MSSAVAELDGMLQAMLSLKPPGVNQNNVKAMQALCTANIQSETVLIQKLYTSFKKAPGNYKLGVLYVVDSVTRLWIEQARKPGQPTGPDAVDGTFAAGVNHVTDLMPSIMTDIINTAPQDQKGKIQKLVDIWERGKTFPEPLLRSFKEKLQADNNAATSTTPRGSPPASSSQQNATAPPTAAAPPPASDPSAILQALANMAKTNTAGSVVPPPGNTNNVANIQNPFSAVEPSSVNQISSVGNPSQAPNPYGALGGTTSFAGLGSFPGMPPQQQTNTGVPPPAPPPVNGITEEQLNLLRMLQAQGLPQDQLAAVVQALLQGGAPAPPPPNANGLGQPGWQGGNQGYGVGSNSTSRDFGGVRSPIGRYGKRSRSRSPPNYDRRRNASPRRRRDSPVYGEYNADASRDSGRNDGGRYGRGRDQANGFGQRSPARHRGSSSPPRQNNDLPPPGPRFIEHEPSLEPDRIKVLSRTLFVGGVTSSQDHIRSIFSEYGKVQTCIVNVDKRHAFVKMLTRGDAMSAKDGMERYKSDEMQLRTRWGVGFGPRDCSDYATGISVIPIDRLTDADRKWMLTAEYGGTGGEPIKGGMVVEEPDIEIGAGVSSKAISRRLATDRTNFSSGGSGLGNPNFDQPSRFRQHGGSSDRNYNRNNNRQQQQNEYNDRNNDHQGFSNNNAGPPPPPMPSFGMPFPQMANGMPIFPPGFVMPGQGPPGAG